MSSRKYADGSRVPIAQSKAEIEKLLTKYGATEYAYVASVGRTRIGFVKDGRAYRLDVIDPDPADYMDTPTGRERSEAAAEAAWEAGCRRKWRAIVLSIKGLLVSIDEGVWSFEQAFVGLALVHKGMATVHEALDPDHVESSLPLLTG